MYLYFGSKTFRDHGSEGPDGRREAGKGEYKEERIGKNEKMIIFALYKNVKRKDTD